MADTVRSEEILGQKVDKCFSDALIKTAGGLGLGVIFSVLFFKRRPWPLALGTGMGLGMAYSNCQHHFQAPTLEYKANPTGSS